MASEAQQTPDAGLEKRPLPEILASVYRTMETGTLAVQARGGLRELFFFNGELKAARSTVEDERLGSWLVRTGLTTEDRMAMGLLAQLGDREAPLGQLLVKNKHLTQEKLQDGLQQLTIAILEAATAERRVNISFHEGPFDEKLDTLSTLSTRQLILISARLVGDAKSQRRLLGSLKRPVDLSAPLPRIRRQFELTVKEEAFLEALATATDLASLRTQLSLNTNDFLSTAYSLFVSGILLIGKQQAEAVAFSSVAAPPSSSQAATTSVPGTPAHLKVQANLARVDRLVNLDNEPGAIQLLEELINDEPLQEYQLKLAQLYTRQKTQARQVLRVLRQMLEANPTFVEGWFELARYWRKAGDPQREQRALERILALQTDNEGARTRLGKLKTRRSEF